MWLPSKNQIESYSRYFLSSSTPLFGESFLNFWWHRCSIWWQTEASRVVEMNVNFIECVWRGGVKSIGFWFGNCIDRVFIGIFYAKERRDMWWYQKSSKREYLPCYVSMNLMNFWYSQLPLSAFHFWQSEIWCFGCWDEVPRRKMFLQTIRCVRKLRQNFPRVINYFHANNPKPQSSSCLESLMQKSNFALLLTLSTLLLHSTTISSTITKEFPIFSFKTVCRCFTIDFCRTFGAQQSSLVFCHVP